MNGQRLRQRTESKLKWEYNRLQQHRAIARQIPSQDSRQTQDSGESLVLIKSLYYP